MPLQNNDEFLIKNAEDLARALERIKEELHKQRLFKPSILTQRENHLGRELCK